jgi:hypothetical protein
MARVMQSRIFVDGKIKADKSKLFITTELPLEGTTVAVNDDAVYKAFNRIADGVICLISKHQWF